MSDCFRKTQLHRKERREAAIALIDEWLANDSGYDEETWPVVAASLNRNRHGERNVIVITTAQRVHKYVSRCG
jgi:Fe-S cluster assembly ATPase SufC